MPDVPYPKALEARPTLRQSLLAQYDRCNLSAKFGLHERNFTSHPAARGQIFHRFAARYLETLAEMQEKTMPTSEAIAILEEVLRQADVDDRDLVTLPMKEIKDLRWTVIKFAHDNGFDIENLIAVEEGLETEIFYPNPHGGFVARRLTGRPDALFMEGVDGIIVLDWKDTWALPGPSEISAEGYFQQRFYALLVFKRYPAVNRVTLREFYPRYSEFREAVVHRDQLEHLEAEFSAIAERFDRSMERDVFPPSPGKHCQNCPLPQQCPIFPGVRMEGTIATGEQAELVAQQLIVAKRAYDHRLKALKAWSEVHGPVPVKSEKVPQVWGYASRKRVARPSKEDMEKAVREAGGKPINIEDLYKEQTQTRFERHTPQEGDPSADALAEEERLMAALTESVNGG